MKSNMGNTDRIARVLIAMLLIMLYFTGTITGTLAIVLLVVASIFLLTGFISFCPLYQLFKINTGKK